MQVSRSIAQRASVLRAMSTVEEGLGGGNELAGGLWILLASWAALRTRALPLALNMFGVVIGLAEILTIVPPLEVLGAVFGFGFILWFGWVGVVMLRGARSQIRPATA